MLELFLRGGPVMWPILLCSLVATTVALERGLFWLRERRHRDARAVAAILERTDTGDFEAAARLGRESSDAAARVLAEGLAHREYGLSEALQIAAQNEVERMQRGLSVLDTIVTVAPLLGILGTVAGVIGAFESLGGGRLQDPEAIRAVTEGIAKALITTAAGLMVAIPALLVYNGLFSALRRASVRLEQIATSLEVADRKGHASR